ncbi:hypothetical protein AS026_31860 [Rhizobium altiplani]|uniref:Uncharacterized protein n=1 Tax=Rhizobium altiplani TaxID=1864509 RepID=A0A109JXZ0_9HYPH|nr:hypothetical protein AS026_31860 [Rhizobium altiplani]
MAVTFDCFNSVGPEQLEIREGIGSGPRIRFVALHAHPAHLAAVGHPHRMPTIGGEIVMQLKATPLAFTVTVCLAHQNWRTCECL